MNNPQSTLPTIVRGDFGAARVSYLRSVGQRNDATAWARVAECELALGDAASALVSATNDADAMLARLRRARALVALGRPSEAVADLRRAIELEPDASDVQELLATLTP